MTIKLLTWFGSKRRLASIIMDHFPEKFGNYYEPFFGSGAIFWRLIEEGRLEQKAYISDINTVLISCYMGIKRNPQLVWMFYEQHKKQHNSKHYKEVQKKLFDYELGNIHEQIAASFLYINATSFSGIYRERNDGHANLVERKQPKIAYLEKETILKASIILQDVEITISDYQHNLTVMNPVKAGDLVYFDPPYKSFGEGDQRTVYNANGFTDKDQIRLKEFCDHLSDQGVYWLQSNSMDEFTYDLYETSNHPVYFCQVPITYKVTHQQKQGNRTFEFIISNYPIDESRFLIEEKPNFAKVN